MRLHGRLPLGYHYFWGRFFSWLMGSVLRYRRDVVITNLSRSFPDKKYHEIKALARAFYGRLGRIAAEVFWFSACRGEKGVERFRRSGLVRTSDTSVINSLLDQGRPVIIFSGHTGNWELLGGFFNAPMGEPFHTGPEDIAVVYHGLSDGTWGQVFEDNRTALVAHTDFDGYVESGRILRFALRHRDRTMVYVFPNDQAPYRGATPHEVGTFMNQPTRCMAGGANLASRLGMAIAYMRWTVTPEGCYDVSYDLITPDASTMPVEDIIRKYYDLLEADINAQPWNYLWSHKRWK